MMTTNDLRNLVFRLSLQADRAFSLGDERQARRLWDRIAELQRKL